MADAPAAVAERKRVYCNRCKDETNHLCQASHGRQFVEAENFWERLIYRFWICAGCDEGTLEVAWTCTGMHNADDEQVYDFTYFPPRASQDIGKKVFRQLPKPLVTIYNEVVSAYNNQLHLLCAAGLRALIEGICQNQGVKGATLETKINNLETILPKNIVEHLHGFRFMGNEAVHELGIPDRQTLQVAIEVSEDLLNFLYELDYKASRLPKKKNAP